MSRSIEVGLTRGDETASKLLIPATSTIRVYGEEDIPELLTQLTDPDADARYRAAMALRGQSSSRDQVVPALTEALKDQVSRVRVAAANAIWSLGPVAKDAGPALVQALRDDVVAVRVAAAEALAGIHADKDLALAPLFELLNDESPEVRIRALRSLQSLETRSQTVIDSVISALDDPDGDVRAGAIRLVVSVMESGDPSIVDEMSKVVRMLEEDSDIEVRRWAAWAIRHVAQFPNNRRVEPSLAVPALKEALRDSDPKLRSGAASALRYYTEESNWFGATEGLVELLSDPDLQVRISASHSLRQDSAISDAATDQLLENAHHDDANLRAAAMSALARLVPDNVSVFPLIYEAVLREQHAPRIEAIRALGVLGPRAEPALPDLMLLSFSENKHVRHAAIWALARIGIFDRQVRSVFEAALEDPVARNRRNAVEGLGVLGPKASDMALALLPLLADENQRVRRSADKAFGALNPSDVAIQRLVEQIDGRVPYVSAEALRGVRRVGPESITALETLLDHPSPLARHVSKGLIDRSTVK